MQFDDRKTKLLDYLRENSTVAPFPIPSYLLHFILFRQYNNCTFEMFKLVKPIPFKL